MIATCLALAAAQPAPCLQAAPWRPIATEADRDRLRDWRTAWTEALEQAGDAAKPMRSDLLFDPDRALDTPMPPAGDYRCRFIKLGGAAKLVMRPWGRCRIATNALTRLDGPQRPMGRLFADSPSRAIFLGTLVLGDETKPLGYGRDDRRDVIGIVERVDVARWRVALPYPGFESTLDLIELVPG